MSKNRLKKVCSEVAKETHLYFQFYLFCRIWNADDMKLITSLEGQLVIIFLLVEASKRLSSYGFFQDILN